MNRLTDIQEIWSYLELMYNHIRNVSRKFEKYISSRTGYIQRKPNFGNEVRQWKNWQTYKKSEIIWKQCTDIPRMCPENLRKLAHPELETSTVNIMSVRKWGNEQTDRHTRNLKLCWTSAETSKECLLKIWKR